MADAPERKPAIVLVEDEPHISIILYRLLRELLDEYEFIISANARDALSHVEQRNVPLVITDYSMPDMNGLELTTRIKEQSPTTYVVLITAFATPELEHQALERGVNSYFAKPFSLDRIEQVVLTALGKT